MSTVLILWVRKLRLEKFNSLISGKVKIFFLLENNVFIDLFLVVLGLCCCMRAFSSLGVFLTHGLLIAVASPVVEHRL